MCHTELFSGNGICDGLAICGLCLRLEVEIFLTFNFEMKKKSFQWLNDCAVLGRPRDHELISRSACDVEQGLSSFCVTFSKSLTCFG